MKKKIFIGLILVIIIVSSGILFTVANSPKNVFTRSLAKNIENIVEREELVKVKELFNSGSISGKYTEGEDLELSGKIYFALEDEETYFENLKFNFFDINLSADIYANEKMFFVKEEEILKEAYGIEYDDLSDQFKKSILYYESDSNYALDEETSKMIVEALENYEKRLTNTVKDLKKLEEKYVKEIVSLIREYGEFEKTKEEVDLNGEKITSRVITLKLDENAIYSILTDLIKYIQEDEDLKEFILEQFLTDKGNSSQGEELYESIMEELNELLEEVEIIKESDIEIAVSVVTPKISDKLLQVGVAIKIENIDFDFEIDFGKEGVQETKEIIVNVNGDKTLEYKINDNNQDNFSLELNKYSKFFGELEKTNLLMIDLNQKEEQFTIGLGEETKIKGKYKLQDNTHTFVPNMIEYDDEEVIVENMEIAICFKDKMPKINKNFTSIFEITEAKIDEIMKKIEETFEE